MKLKYAIHINLLLLAVNTVSAQQAILKTGPKLKSAQTVVMMNLINEEPYVFTSNYWSDKYMQGWHISRSSLAPIGNSKIITAPRGRHIDVATNSAEYYFHCVIALENKNVIFFKKYENRKKTIFYREFDKSYEPLGPLLSLETNFNNTENDSKNLVICDSNDKISFKTNQKKDKILMILESNHITRICVYNAMDMKEIIHNEYELGISNYGASSIFADNGYIYSIIKIQNSHK